MKKFKKVLVVLFVLSVVLYTNIGNETAQPKVKGPITTLDLPFIH
ncbi:hypothetical protein SAMN05518872_101644 [Psychrobacillus sp. OK032]|nr:hypothetical protein SAMN05518872_101644 [Psychrobacillus sp. OK032]